MGRNLCSTELEVKLVQAQFDELYANYVNDRGAANSEMVRRLKELKRNLEHEEVEFYKRLNLGQPDRSTLEIMQQKINELNRNKGFLAMSNAADGFDKLIAGVGDSATIDPNQRLTLKLPEEFDKYVTSAKFANTMDDYIQGLGAIELATILNEAIVERAQRYIKPESGKILTTSLKTPPKDSPLVRYSPAAAQDYALEGLPKLLEKELPYFIKLFDTKVASRGLGALIEDWDIKRTAPDQSTITFKMNADSGRSVLQRLKKEFGLDVSSGSPTEGAAIARVLKFRLQQLIGTTSPIWPYVEYEFDTNYVAEGRFDVNKSVSSIKGFLGEVKAAAAMDYICGIKGAARPTGNLHYQLAQYKVEVPIDLWFNSAGFQIKNYVIDKAGKVEFVERGANMHTVLINRFNIEQGITDILEQLFVAQAYNTPAIIADRGYKETYGHFKEEEYNAKSLMKDYAYNVFKLEKSFTDLENQIFTNPDKPYYNTFFIINSTIVPGSDIIGAFIEVLESKGIFDKDDKISTNISIYYPKDPTAYTGKKPNETPSFDSVASKIQIGYTVALHLNEILEKAYTRALMKDY